MKKFILTLVDAAVDLFDLIQGVVLGRLNANSALHSVKGS